MTTLVLTPGAVGLSDWRAIWHGAPARLDPGSAPAIAASAAAVARILAKGEPVYGINTGFGKLASVRIDDADLATLQRNIVLSHAAGTGAPSPVAVVRLMMALKLASLAQGASGIRPETVALLRALLKRTPRGEGEPIFVNRYGDPLKASGVRFKLKKYVAGAVQRVPSLAGKRVSPHKFRHAPLCQHD